MSKEKTSKSQIIQVHFFEPVEGKTDYYFGSLRAIFAQFGQEHIGTSLGALYAARITQTNAKVTTKCRIIKQEVTRISQKQD